jgi:hypothetical protein
MQVGDLVKWNKNDKDYGDLGLVVAVHSKGNYTVYWVMDNVNEWYRKGTKWVVPLCRDKLEVL